jgi:hypothetical protein
MTNRLRAAPDYDDLGMVKLTITLKSGQTVIGFDSLTTMCTEQEIIQNLAREFLAHPNEIMTMQGGLLVRIEDITAVDAEIYPGDVDLKPVPEEGRTA